MKNEVTQEQVLKAIEKVEHIEIAETLINLGMILDVAVDKNIAKVAFALPMFGIPDAVRNALAQSIQKPIETLGLQMQIQFFEMTPEARERFFAMAKAAWKAPGEAACRT